MDQEMLEAGPLQNNPENPSNQNISSSPTQQQQQQQQDSLDKNNNSNNNNNPADTNSSSNSSSNSNIDTSNSNTNVTSPILSNQSTGTPNLNATEIIIDAEQRKGLSAIQNFLKSKTSYDVLPVSFRLVVLDTSLLVKKSLTILLQNGIVSAPLWNSKTSRFAGLLTAADYINVIQYYFQNPDKMDKIEDLTLNGLREVEKAIGAVPIETISIYPFKSLYEACVKMTQSKARRIPLIDVDEETGREVVVSVLTQYRILKFVALNVCFFYFYFFFFFFLLN